MKEMSSGQWYVSLYVHLRVEKYAIFSVKKKPTEYADFGSFVL